MMADAFSEIRKTFGGKTTDPRQLSGLTLAFIGDTVYEAVNRSLTVLEGEVPVHQLHLRSIERANARTQSRMAMLLEKTFTEEEAAVYRRGRNAEVYTRAKNASVSEYHHATGLEAVIAYLFLLDRTDRILELLKTGWEAAGVL